MPTTISIVEDNRDTCKHLEDLLNGEPGLHCLSTYNTGEAAVAGVPAEKPDLVLMDINLPRMSGIECVQRLKEKIPALQILMLTAYQESDLIFNSLRAGACGYLLKKTLSTDLIPAIELARAGGAPMSMQIARKVMDHFHGIQQPSSEVEKLTPREYEILALLANGNLYKEIGEHLGIAHNTVKNHIQHIYEKLHVQSRMQAVKKFHGQS
jgi:DNA-binding NarL/FixJ family response regulator